MTFEEQCEKDRHALNVIAQILTLFWTIIAFLLVVVLIATTNSILNRNELL